MTFQEYIRRLILIKNFFGRGGQERERGEGEKEKLRGEMNGVLLVKKKKKEKKWRADWVVVGHVGRGDCIKEARKKNIRERVSSRQDRALASH